MRIICCQSISSTEWQFQRLGLRSLDGSPSQNCWLTEQGSFRYGATATQFLHVQYMFHCFWIFSELRDCFAQSIWNVREASTNLSHDRRVLSARHISNVDVLNVSLFFQRKTYGISVHDIVEGNLPMPLQTHTNGRDWGGASCNRASGIDYCSMIALLCILAFSCCKLTKSRGRGLTIETSCIVVSHEYMS